MRLLLKILLIALLAFAPLEGFGKKKQPYLHSYIDTLVSLIRVNAAKYNSQRPDFDANIFIKGNVDILNRNFLQQYLPYMKRASKNTDNYYAEFMGVVTSTNPNIYNQTIITITPSEKNFIERSIDALISPILRMRVYSPIYYSNIYSPFAPNSDKYYKFAIDSIWQRNGNTYYKISYAPKLNNYMFVEGNFVATNRNWSIREMTLKGSMEFVDYTNHVIMGEEGAPDEFLPKKVHTQTNSKVLGNHFRGDYITSLKYNKIEESHFVKGRGREKYNLSLLYNTQTENITEITNTLIKYRDSVNKVELQAIESTEAIKGIEKENENENFEQIDTALIIRTPGTLEKMGRFFVSNHSVDLKKMGELRLSPIVSPILFNYSSTHGISYTQKLTYTKQTHKDQLFRIEPRIGYNFKYKEFYWGLRSSIEYAPKHMGRLFIDAGNGNTIITDRIMNELNKLPFMVFDSTRLKLTHFRNSYAKIGHQIELSNGLSLTTNLALQNYEDMNNSDLTILFPQSNSAKRANEIAKEHYISFVPEIELKYTPHQYYYYNGNRKVYLYSRFPTLALNYAKAIKGVFNSTTKYDKVEFDMNQQVDLSPMHKLYYRVGYGIFFNYSDLFFTEFNNLRKNNLPIGWDEEMGGTFQLLARHEYTEIDKYLRTNVTYDAPLLLVPTLFKNVKYITKEKLYCNILLVDTMLPYIETGYGIGTHLFNVGIFWGGEINKMNRFGVKFTFEIFN